MNTEGSFKVCEDYRLHMLLLLYWPVYSDAMKNSLEVQTSINKLQVYLRSSWPMTRAGFSLCLEKRRLLHTKLFISAYYPVLCKEKTVFNISVLTGSSRHKTTKLSLIEVKHQLRDFERKLLSCSAFISLLHVSLRFGNQPGSCTF